jgi:hypothetical protein
MVGAANEDVSVKEASAERQMPETLREWGPISAAARGGSGVSERTVQRWANPAWAKARGLEPLPVKRDALGRRWITRSALEAWERACLSCDDV